MKKTYKVTMAMKFGSTTVADITGVRPVDLTLSQVDEVARLAARLKELTLLNFDLNLEVAK